MWYAIAMALLVLWLLGLVSSFTLGGLIHLLMLMALIIVLLRLTSGRQPIDDDHHCDCD